MTIGMSFSRQFLTEAKQVIDGLDVDAIDRAVSYTHLDVYKRQLLSCCVKSFSPKVC